MAILLIVGIILFFVVLIVISTFINNTKYRAKQQILGQVGLSSANINAGFNRMQEEGALNRFFNDYPNYNEKIVKDTFYSFALNIINLQNNGYMSEKVLNKMTNDKILEKFRNLSFVRINILGYNNNRLSVITVFQDNRDEYQLMMNISIVNNLFYIDSYDAMRGIAKGL